MVRRLVLVVVVTSAACIKLSAFHPLGGGSDAGDDAGGDGPTADAAPAGSCGIGSADTATAKTSGTAICAAGPGYVLRFPATGFHYPDQLLIGSDQVLGKTTGCNEEADIGMEVYPLPPFAADTTAMNETATATIVAAGPVVAKVVVNWSWHASAGCVSSGTPLSGISMFTLFPDGRLVRFDQLTTAPANTVSPCDCGTGAQAFGVDGYIAFDPSLMPKITDQGGTMIEPFTGAGSATPQLACVNGSDWGVGVARLLANGRARITTMGGAIVLTSDYAFGGSAVGGGINPTVTAYQIGSASCTPLLQPIEQFTMSTGPQLHIHSSNSFDDITGTQHDGMYGGDNGGGSGIPVGSGMITLTTSDTIPGGWALWVGNARLMSPAASPQRSSGWFQIQNGASDGILWVRDALGSGDTITVMAQ